MEATSPAEAYLDLQEADIPDELLPKLQRAAEASQWARIAATPPKLLLSVTAQPVQQVNSVSPNNTNKNTANKRRWLVTPTKGDMAALLEIPAEEIKDIRLGDTGCKAQVTLKQTSIPRQTHIKDGEWDYRVFITAINNTKNIAFIQPYHDLQDQDGKVSQFLGQQWFGKEQKMETRQGTTWRIGKNGPKNVTGTWLITNQALTRTTVPSQIRFQGEPLARVFTPWEDLEKRNKDIKEKDNNNKKRKAPTETPPKHVDEQARQNTRTSKRNAPNGHESKNDAAPPTTESTAPLPGKHATADTATTPSKQQPTRDTSTPNKGPSGPAPKPGNANMAAAQFLAALSDTQQQPSSSNTQQTADNPTNNNTLETTTKAAPPAQQETVNATAPKTARPPTPTQERRRTANTGMPLNSMTNFLNQSIQSTTTFLPSIPVPTGPKGHNE